VEAAKKAIKSPLIEEISIDGARGALINISAGSNLTLYEANEAASIIQEAAGSEANIIFGTVIDETMVDEMRVTVIATGFHLNKQGKFETPEETVTGRRPRRVAPAVAAAEAMETATAPVDPDGDTSDWDADLDYPAILRKKMAG
jgi:cell division protein FtsZ